MQIVIDLDETLYEIIKNPNKFPTMQTANRVCEVVENGIVLPKGHGRMGDLDALREEVSSWGMNDYEPSDFTDAIDEAETIIEADKESEVENGDNGLSY